MIVSNKIRCLIIDDEKNSREVLRKLLKQYEDGIDVIGEASDTDEAYVLIHKENPQLIFLDIQMPGGDGFSLLKRFEQINFEVIFVTSYDQYAINAIRFNALDYLLKPIDTIELENALNKVVQKITNLPHGMLSPKKIPIHVGGKVRLIPVDQIAYIEANGRYSTMFMLNKERFTTPRSLKDMEEYFENNTSFIRISKGLSVNASMILEYSKGEIFTIKLTTGHLFEVSRRKKAEVLEKIKR